MSKDFSTRSRSYRIPMLKTDNWALWKRRMLAVLTDLGLESHIAEGAKIPEIANPDEPTKEELDAQRKWLEHDAKARCKIELSISDAELMHISGATTARQMWEQLTTLKESKSLLEILAIRRALYRTTAVEGFSMIEHIAKLRQLQEELNLAGSEVTDEAFVMIIMTSLPESWDTVSASYLESRMQHSSHELTCILLQEERRRNAKLGGQGTTTSRGKNQFGRRTAIEKSDNLEKECYNCHKKGYISKECWAKGRGCEGQGPKGRQRPNRVGRTHPITSDVWL